MILRKVQVGTSQAFRAADGGLRCGTEINRVGQNCICTPYITVCMVIFLPKIPYICCIYVCMYGCGQP
jgi:hypothetical protein